MYCVKSKFTSSSAPHLVAKEILSEQKLRNASIDYVFNLIPSENEINRHIKNWVESAGIQKKITFHIARHTFATLLLSSDVNIYEVSQLLGHKNVRETHIYANLIDKKRDEAVMKLPSI